MDRRTALRSIGVAAVTAAAGCTSGVDDGAGNRLDRYETVDGGTPTEPPTPTPEPFPVEVDDFELFEADDGSLAATVFVVNGGSEVTEAEIVATLSVDGQERDRSTRTAVDPAGRTEVVLTFDLPEEEFWSGGDNSLGFEARRPS